MSEQPMTPAEAAATADEWFDWLDLDEVRPVLRVLIDHARATDPELIASLAEEADQIAHDLSGVGIVSRSRADDIAERAAALAVALSIPTGKADS